MLLAGAIAVTGAIAMPVLAQTTRTNTPQAQPAPISAPEQPGGDEQGGDGPGMHGGGNGGMHGWGMHGWGMHGWGMRGGPMMHHEMWRRAMMRSNPQERCTDRLAWRAARRAYVEAKLDLTAEQRPLWDKVQTIAQGEQQKERQLCGQLKPGEEATVLDRMDRAQQFLSARLDALQSAKPAVQALYQSLTPEQKEVFDHPFRHD
jgi:hypothetical protein